MNQRYVGPMIRGTIDALPQYISDYIIMELNPYFLYALYLFSH